MSKGRKRVLSEVPGETAAEYQRRWKCHYYASHRVAASDYHHKGQLKALYGITPEDYATMAKAQSYVCAICKGTTKSRLHVDHNHATREVRGLLCSRCNTALGLLQDSPNLCREAAAYLTRGYNMTQITGGRVRFMKRIQTAQFEPVEAEAEFTFGVTEGDDEARIVGRASALAQNTVEVLLTEKLGKSSLQLPIETKEEVAAKATRKSRTTPPPAVEKPTTMVEKPTAETKPVEDDLGLEDDSPNAVEVKHTEKTVVEVDDLDLGLDEPNPPPAEVTDVELTTAVARRNGELIKVYQEKEGEAAGKKGTLLIRALLKDKFNDAKIRELPQAQRHEFLKQLDALTYVKA